MHHIELLGIFRLLGDSLDGSARRRGRFQRCKRFGDGFRGQVNFGISECEGLWGRGGSGALRGPIDSNRFFPEMSIFRIVLAAFETLPHMPDFRSSVSSCARECFGLLLRCMTLVVNHMLSERLLFVFRTPFI